jgi:predicted nuclease of predicted toxin-antitoxin system
MRILCDQNVPEKYRSAFDQADGITVATVRDELRADASDTEIARFASANDWVVFTNDDDFFSTPGEFGLLLYDQIEDPTAGDVLQAVRAIAQAYPDDREIVEKIPDGWV